MHQNVFGHLKGGKIVKIEQNWNCISAMQSEYKWLGDVDMAKIVLRLEYEFEKLLVLEKKNW